MLLMTPKLNKQLVNSTYIKHVVNDNVGFRLYRLFSKSSGSVSQRQRSVAASLGCVIFNFYYTFY